MLRRFTVVIVFNFFAYALAAQNLESIGKDKPVAVSGGVSLNQIFYTASGIDERRDPYSLYASGNVNFTLYGWSVPLSFSYSNQNTSFQQPFNQYSLHPTYKWITGHLGYNSMSFSPYTVNGHIFLGGGVDLAPEGKWKLTALYGRFLKAVEPDTTQTNAKTPSFKRMGYGLKASYGDEGNFVDITMFRSKDDINSISFVPDSLQVLPEQNLVFSIGGGKTLFDNFLLRAEIASSALTHDVRSDEMKSSQPLSKVGFLYTPRTSSSYYKAFKTSLDYQQDLYTIGVGYERIDPEYRTHGAYFFNSDLESITLNGSASIWEGKLNVALSGGTQRDNLDKSKVSTMRRTVGSINVNYVPSEKLNVSLSYSTFQTFTNIRSKFIDINQLTPYDNLDTLNYTQISKSANAMVMYTIGTRKDRRQNVNLNLSIQNAMDKQGGETQNSGNRFYTLNLAYALAITPQNVTLSVAMNGNVNESPMINTKTWGPTASISKTFFDRKLRATVSSSYNNAYANSQRVNTILNGRINGSYSIMKKHHLNLSLVAVNRKSNSEISTTSFTEFTGTLGYSYAFGTK
jgi:hypothetical protein